MRSDFPNARHSAHSFSPSLPRSSTPFISLPPPPVFSHSLSHSVSLLSLSLSSLTLSLPPFLPSLPFSPVPPLSPPPPSCLPLPLPPCLRLSPSFSISIPPLSIIFSLSLTSSLHHSLSLS